MPRKSKMKETGRANVKTMAVNRVLQEQLSLLAGTIQQRRALAHGLGKSYEGQRDLYLALGYKKVIEYTDYLDKYERQDIAKRIVTAYPDATWRGEPVVYETEDPEPTSFEEAWQELARDKNVLQYLTRLDKMAGIGRYAVLYLGFSDVEKPEDAQEEVTKAEGNELLFLQPYSETNAEVNTWDNDHSSERYGLPMTYKLKVKNLNNATGTKADESLSTTDVVVHWSRVIHAAEGLLESNVYGTPRLKAVFNRLDNLDLIAGGSAESMWRGGFPGLAFELDPEAELTPQDAEDLDKQIDEYVHSLRRYLRLQGMKANSLNPQIADPDSHVKVQLELISGATGIPVRILTGSERGELASTQDKENWSDRVSERRKDFAEPSILRPFVDRLIESGVLPEPAEGYFVAWPDVNALSDKEQAEIAQIRTKAIAEYVKAGAEMLIPPYAFLTSIMGFEQTEAEAMLDELEQMLKEEEEDAAAMADEEAIKKQEEEAAMEDEEEEEDAA